MAEERLLAADPTEHEGHGEDNRLTEHDDGLSGDDESGHNEPGHGHKSGHDDGMLGHNIDLSGCDSVLSGNHVVLSVHNTGSYLETCTCWHLALDSFFFMPSNDVSHLVYTFSVLYCC
jgi:hypothetical protein